MTHSTTFGGDGDGEDGPRANGRPAAARIRRVERDADGLIVVHIEGRDDPLVDARLARYFPWSMPEAYVSVRDSDGREAVMLETLDQLDPASRRVVEDELRDKVFNPKILRIVKYKREFGISSVTVETDRGEVTFQFRSRDDVRVLSPTRALFRDADGNTYELPDLTRLDPASQKHVRHFF